MLKHFLSKRAGQVCDEVTLWDESQSPGGYFILFSADSCIALASCITWEYCSNTLWGLINLRWTKFVLSPIFCFSVYSVAIRDLGTGRETVLSYLAPCYMLEKAETREHILPEFGRWQGVQWPLLPTQVHPQMQVRTECCHLPRASLFWTHRGLYPGRTSGNQHIPKQMFRHSGQLPGHLCVIYLLSCLWCCPKRHLGSSETWRGLRRQEGVLAMKELKEIVNS